MPSSLYQCTGWTAQNGMDPWQSARSSTIYGFIRVKNSWECFESTWRGGGGHSGPPPRGEGAIWVRQPRGAIPRGIHLRYIGRPIITLCARHPRRGLPLEPSPRQQLLCSQREYVRHGSPAMMRGSSLAMENVSCVPPKRPRHVILLYRLLGTSGYVCGLCRCLGMRSHGGNIR